MKTIHFISGLPRSGSTLLANILSQNPRFYTTGTSGILELLFNVRSIWNNIAEFKATPDEKAKHKVLKGILESYFYTDHPVVFDKSRGWLAYIEMAEWILERKIKILVPVRDIRDVLASFEKLWRITSQSEQTGIEKEYYVDFQDIRRRTEVWLGRDKPVGIAHTRIKDAIARGFRDRLYFVKFETLTSFPKETMDGIYSFLGEKPYKHNFDYVEQLNHEDDSVFGFKNLHKIRNKVEPMEPEWPKVLGHWAYDYSKLNFWDTPNGIHPLNMD